MSPAPVTRCTTDTAGQPLYFRPMSWSLHRNYARSTPAAEALMARSGRRYIRLAPPAVSVPLLVLAGQVPPPDLDLDFRAWAASATVLDAEALCARVPEVVKEYYCIPDRDELLSAKWFSVVADTRVACYGAETFGGATEYEWCWFFDRGNERVNVMAWSTREVERTVRRWFRTHTVKSTASLRVLHDFTADTHSQRPYEETVAIFDDVAGHLGVSAPGGCFLPHRRGFDWSRYSVEPARPAG